MSTSLLYHGFGIRGYQYLNSQYKGGKILFEIEQDKHDLRCSHCGSQNVIRRPKAAIVFDRFHVVKLYNEKLDDLRRHVYKNATDALEKQAIKGTRWILLKNPENLDTDKNEPQRLQETLQINQALAVAYYLKDALREFWYQPPTKRLQPDVFKTG